MRKLISFRNLVYVALLVLIVVVVIGTINNRNQEFIKELRNLKRETVKVGNLEQVVITSGRVKSRQVEQIFANHSGKILEIKVSENQPVNKDDVLVVIERTTSKGKIKEKLKAPRAATVMNIKVAVNQQVVKDQSLILELVDLNDLQVEAQVVEADVAKLQVEQESELSFSALGGVQVRGKVSFIDLKPVNQGLLGDDPRASASQNSLAQATSGEGVSYRVDVMLAEKPENLKLGMNADIEIVVARRDSVLVVSDSYIYKKEGKNYVKIYQQNGEEISIKEQEVETGFRGETSVEIISGLTEGQEIALPTAEIRNSRSGFGFFGGNGNG